MQYCSVAFLGVFLPLTLLFYCVIPKRKRWLVLLIASYIFFWSLSGKLLIYLLFSTFSIHHFGLWLDKLYKDRQVAIATEDKEEKKLIKKEYDRKAKRIMFLAVVIHIGLLLYLKYSTFFGMNFNSLFELMGWSFRFKIEKILIPIGISFYTLQGLSYIIDVYKGKINADSNLERLALFMAFFPCIMEGPICRYSDTADKIYECNKITYYNLCYGLQRILWGLFKKIVIADRLNILVKTVFNAPSFYNGTTIFIAAVSYTIMLYMDFSGAMDVVVGTGNIFGFSIPENFKQPFFSKNISEFWTRWHISLGTWFKDYIYYPISLSKPMKKITLNLRKKLGNHYGPLLSGTIALLVVWLLNGLWHGAGWTFILFGLYHFLFISIGNITRQSFNKLYVKLNITKSKVLQILQILKTSFFVVIGELIFRSNTVSDAIFMIKKIFTSFGFNSSELSSLGLDIPDVVVLLLALLIVLIISIMKEKNIDVREKISSKNIFIRWLIYYSLIFGIIIFGAFGPGYEPVDPMYADF